jgi:hypothetical protein
MKFKKPQGRWGGIQALEKKRMSPPPARENKLQIFVLNRKDWLSCSYVGLVWKCVDK